MILSVLLLNAVFYTSSVPLVDDPIAEPPPVVTRTLKSAKNVTLNIHSNGNYEIFQNGTLWLRNSATFFTSRGHTYSTSSGNLHQIGFGQVEHGWDNLGDYSAVRVRWQAQDCNNHEVVPASADEPIAEPPPCTKSTVVTIFRAYTESSLVVFSQSFEHVGFSGTTVNDKNKVCTGFPTFQIDNSHDKLGYLSYGGLFLANTAMGMWEKGTGHIQSGLYGGPLVLFDQQQRSMVMAPFKEFMTGSIHYNTQTNAVEWGILGSAKHIPQDFTYETAIVFAEGVKPAIEEYGAMLLKHYGKTRSAMVNDFTSDYLGYWTDNGAYYYYKTAPDMNYDETLMKVKEYSDGLNIPYRYMQIDSWWYFKGADNGVKNWTSRTDVFPNGLQDFYNRVGLPIVAHNRWWSSETQYAKANGGKWNFIVEKENKKAIPQDEEFWDYLIATSKEWGLAVYEQDWLNNEFEQMNATLEDVTVARTWMNTMSAGASKNGIPIQLCMPMPRHLLQSVEMPAVTQSRASGDYQPGNSQWNIGTSSILLHALGINPYKDNFWTTVTQPGNPYARKEINPPLQSVVATLSTGPVGPSDMLDHANATLIMRSCNADGKLLQPSRPAMTLSGEILAGAFGGSSMNAVNGIIWSTVSEIPFGQSHLVFGHILAIEVDRVTMLTPTSADFGIHMLAPSMAYSDADPMNSITHFDEKTPLMIPLMLAKDFQLWHTTPIMKLKNSTVLLLGELSKWVPVSPDRIDDISLTPESLNIAMTGAAHEKVTMTFMFNQKPFHATCSFSESLNLVLKVMNMGNYKCIAA